ncbi:MAG: osmoprotectant transport system permease protein [Thermoleophilaceae bacterium]|jgi:osmoprotectant transport system permease protein|nr:osmoprotectant transport system permease protein [Thermoleophilaceae bacterium]
MTSAALAVKLAAAGPVIPNFGGSGNTCVRQNKTFCWDWFQANWSGTFQPAVEDHLRLTVIAVAIGFVIAMGAAMLAYRYAWFETPFSRFSLLLYTIPSLALFQFLVPITGLTDTTVEIALVSYTLLVLFSNILVGLRGVPDDVREAAAGMGLTPRQTLMRVQLPLALPAIMAGLRIATVLVISLATIAAIVVDEGLGSPIFNAIQNDFKTKFVASAVLAVLLALVADVVLVGIQRLLTPWTRRAA